MLRRWMAFVVTGISVAFATIAACYDMFVETRNDLHAPRQTLRRVRRMPFEIVPFFLSFCLLLRGAESAGLTRYAEEAVMAGFQRGPVVGSVASGFWGILAANVTNNIPAAILFEKTWLGNAATLHPIDGLAHRLAALDPSYPKIFADVCVYASNFGANLTFIGSLAGLMWLRILRNGSSAGLRVPTLKEFCLYGLLIVPIVTVTTCTAIALFWTSPG